MENELNQDTKGGCTQCGGGLQGNPPSSWGWVKGTVGDGMTQFNNTFKLSSNTSQGQTNALVPDVKPTQSDTNIKQGGALLRVRKIGGRTKSRKIGGALLRVRKIGGSYKSKK